MIIKIGNYATRIPASWLENNFFAVDLPDAVLVTIANNDGEYSVYKAMNGRGENVYAQFKDLKVEVLP